MRTINQKANGYPSQSLFSSFSLGCCCRLMTGQKSQRGMLFIWHF